MNLNSLTKRKDILVAIGAICLGIVVALNIHKSQLAKIASIQENIKEEKEKNDLIVVLNKLDNKFNIYKERLKKQDSSFIVDRVTEFGRQNQIRVSALNPGNAQEQDIFVKVPLNISFEGTYHQLGNFISLIESSADFLMVESLSILAPELQGGYSEKISMIVNSIYLKEQTKSQ